MVVIVMHGCVFLYFCVFSVAALFCSRKLSVSIGDIIQQASPIDRTCLTRNQNADRLQAQGRLIKHGQALLAAVAQGV